MSNDTRLRSLLAEGLRLLHAAHRQGAEQAAANIGSSSLPKLKQMLKAGAALNLAQAKRLEPLFTALGRDVENRTDRAMGGIADANRALVAKADGRATRDLANIASGQVAAHFYIATYGTMRAYARALGLRDAVSAFDRTLAETARVDLAFTRLANRIMGRIGDVDYPGESAFYTTAALHPARSVAATLALAAAGIATFVAVASPVKPARHGLRRLRWR